MTPIESKEQINRWINFLHNLLDNKTVSRIGLLKHWYNQGLDDEIFQINETKKISINEITQEYLLNLEEDVLYEFLPAFNF